jgi:AAA15 family ATPase/GTPase
LNTCKITKLSIKNFKTFENVSFHFNEKLNILTGVNNSGKTTVLEAIALWNECFYKLIKQSLRGDDKVGITKGQYRLGNKAQNYVDYTDIVSVRSPYLSDIFYNLDTTKTVELSMQVDKNSSVIDIAFSITKASGTNYEIKLISKANFNYTTFNELFEMFPMPINTVFASPISNILLNEEFKTEPVIKDSIQKRESIKVLRNRLYNLSDENFLEFEKLIAYILGKETKLKTDADKKRDIKLDYDIKTNPKDTFKNISLVGSGTLQIIEILLSIFDEKKDLNIILLDEPDSHIHRDIQKRLLDILIKNTPNTQIFITTHNESLIRSSSPEYIFHLEGDTIKEYSSIIKNKNEAQKVGLQPSRQLKILQSIGSESALDLINALESDRLILVEGKSDPQYLDIIINKKYVNKKFNLMYWSFDGIENIFKHIFSYKELFGSIKNEKTLWEKSVLVLDKDLFTDLQAQKLENELKSKLGILVYIWKSYTLESVLLMNIDKLTELIYGYLHGIEVVANQEDIKEQIQSSIVSLSEAKKTYFDDSKGDVLKWIKDRRENLAKNGLTNNILPNETAFSEIKEFHLSKLNNGDISSLATKEDVELIVSSVFAYYEVKKIPLLVDILINTNISTFYDEWNKMTDSLRLM